MEHPENMALAPLCLKSPGRCPVKGGGDLQMQALGGVR